MTLAERLTEYVRACFTGLWIESHEHEDALAEIHRLCRDESWRLATWDVDRGLRLAASDHAVTDVGPGDPLAGIKSLNALASDDGTALLVLVNFHRFLGGAEIVQALAHQIAEGKQNRTFVVILSPIVQIPIELEKLFVVVEHELPDRMQVEQIARDIATEKGELPDAQELTAVLDSAAGLTRYEAEGAFSLSLVQRRRIEPAVIWEIKSQMLKKSGLLTLHRGSESFAQLGGLEALKAFCLRAMRRQGEVDALKRPRGVALVSPPGCGKSQFAKALGNETGRPTLVLDVGSLMGSLVGQTESQTRQALRVADAMAPCILYVDEIDKGLSGVASSGQGDSGVMARLFGQFLSWLNDHTTDVFVIVTCNDSTKLPPEFFRSERFDGLFMLDLPSPAERAVIWEIYLKLFALDRAQKRPQDTDWTGAEIRSCCRLSALLEVPLIEAARNVVPVAITAGETVERLRSWAAGRCLAADRSGVYSRGASATIKPGRRVSRDPSNN
jgi:hypothetical protein